MAWIAQCQNQNGASSWQDHEECLWISKKKYHLESNCKKSAKAHKCSVGSSGAKAVQIDGRELKDMKWGD